MFSVKQLFRVVFILFAFPSIVLSQDIPFSEKFFPDKQIELKAAITEITNGDEYFAAGPQQFRFAIPHYEKAYAFNASNADLCFRLGACYLAIRNKSKAKNLLLKAIELNPGVDPQAYYFMGRVCQLSLQFDEAISYYLRYTEYLGNDEPVDNVSRRIEECRNGKELVKTPVDVMISNLGVTVNTASAEYNPLITADESELYFTSRRPLGTGTETDPSDLEFYEDIYTSKKENGKWSLAKNIGQRVNTPTHDAGAGLSLDGQILFVFRGDRNGGDILISHKTKSGWSFPEDVGENINTKHHESSACLSPDEKTLYFVSSKPGGYGGRDIYKSSWNSANKTWMPAINLGNIINTEHDEEGVYMHPDGKTLYFSSRGHNSMGGYDIFFSIIENNNWTKPKNIGYPVSTPDDDIYFVVSASRDHAYYASTTDQGFGDKDLYQITFGSDKNKPVSRMAIVKGFITDVNTSEPVNARIELIDLNRQEQLGSYHTDGVTGKYLVSLPAGRKYGAFVYADNYLFESMYFEVHDTSAFREINMDIAMKPISEGTNIVLNNIFFDTDKSELKKDSESTLKGLVKMMNDFPTVKVEISGHTDNEGPDEYNMNLSKERAKSVAEYLIQNGISPDRITYNGYGETRPLVPNINPENKRINRRIEFRINSK